jgi:hypothetical protein
MTTTSEQPWFVIVIIIVFSLLLFLPTPFTCGGSFYYFSLFNQELSNLTSSVFLGMLDWFL